MTTATVVATRISHSLLGTAPSFYIPALETPDFQLTHPWGLIVFFVLGAAMGVVSVAFIRGLYWMEDLFEAMPGNYYTRHAQGMLCVGVMMFLLSRHAGHFYVEGVGYATVMDILRGSLSSPWFLPLLAALKLLATCLSLGSGASGGVFSPALFMGAAGGAAFGHLCQVLIPGLDIVIPTFAIAGMAAAIGGSTGAVLTGIIMLSEMTGDYSTMLPLVITCSVAYAVRKGIMEESIYTMKLRARRHPVPEGLHASVLTSERVRDLMATDFTIVPQGGAAPTGPTIVVHSENALIAGVARHPDTESGATAVGSAGRFLRYVLVAEQATPLGAVTALWEAEAEVILVSRNPESRRAEDVVGVVTPAALARLFKVDEDLS